MMARNFSDKRKNTYLRIAFLMLLLGSVFLSGCSTSENTQAYHLAPLSEMDPAVHGAPETVQAAYRFAYANPDVLSHIPCYCGCGGMGHTSNYACFVNEKDGQQNFESHALGCSICVDIALDTMRLMNQGKTVAEIQEFVDGKYSAFGPSNIP